VLDGRAAFVIGSERHEARAGTLLEAPPGTPHTIEVEGTNDLVFLATVMPNEDRPDETIELADH
jgi:mannose-6-phosphate isomerase-like protein (cupin superfamily)